MSHCHKPLPVVRCGERAEAASEVFIEVILVGELRTWDRCRALICHARPHVRGQVRKGACRGCIRHPLAALCWRISAQSRCAALTRIAQGGDRAEIGRRIARGAVVSSCFSMPPGLAMRYGKMACAAWLCAVDAQSHKHIVPLRSRHLAHLCTACEHRKQRSRSTVPPRSTGSVSRKHTSAKGEAAG